MIAHIIPLKRLPRQIDILDYLVPDQEKERIQVGQLVVIPFRKSTLHGLVFSLSDEFEKPLKKEYKELLSIVQSIPFLHKTHLTYLSTIAKWYATSLATVASMALPPLQKRKLRSANIRPFSAKRIAIPPRTPPTYLHYHNESEHATKLTSTIKGTTLILVPEVQHLSILFRHLTSYQDDLVVWHSELSQKEQFEAWMKVRNGEKKIIIGTRGAVFLPFPKLDRIIIDFEQKENHKHWDQNPRFHVKDIAELLAKLYGAPITHLSYSPSAEAYFLIHKNKYSVQSDRLCLLQKNEQVQLVNMKDERRAGNYNIFAESVETALRASTGNVFIHLNRRGYATAVICQDCAQTLSCPTCTTALVYSEKTRFLSCHYCHYTTPLPATCPTCLSPLIQMKGLGIEQVDHQIRKIFPQTNIDILRIDKDTNVSKKEHTTREIIIGTDTAFSFVDWSKTDCVVFLDVDKDLAHPEYRTEERVWQRLMDVIYFMNTSTNCFIQTYNPRHLVYRSLSEPDRFYRTTLNQRKTFLYPPYSSIVRLLYGHGDQHQVKQSAERLRTVIQTELTRNKKKAILSQALEMNPRYYRRKYWYTLIVRFPVDQWQDDLVWLNTLVPTDWKVDPNPISLLSP